MIFFKGGEESFRIPFPTTHGTKCPETKLEVKKMTERSNRVITTARIVSSALVVAAYYTTLYHNTKIGAMMHVTADFLAMPYMIKAKCWDIVALLTFLILIGLPRIFM